MDKVEWLQSELNTIASGKSDFWPEGNNLVKYVEERGPTLTRKEFFQKLTECFKDSLGDFGPSEDSIYALEHFYRDADFSKAWDTEPHQSIPRVDPEVAVAAIGEEELVSFGGKPNWIQLPNTPICVDCQRDMTLLLQFKSPSLKLMAKYPQLKGMHIGDCGQVYVFFCGACGHMEMREDSY